MISTAVREGEAEAHAHDGFALGGIGRHHARQRVIGHHDGGIDEIKDVEADIDHGQLAGLGDAGGRKGQDAAGRQRHAQPQEIRAVMAVLGARAIGDGGEERIGEGAQQPHQAQQRGGGGNRNARHIRQVYHQEGGQRRPVQVEAGVAETVADGFRQPDGFIGLQRGLAARYFTHTMLLWRRSRLQSAASGNCGLLYVKETERA
ncbi:MAG: hypothetical protein WDN06_18135 [Asticcacaulis sp.]